MTEIPTHTVSTALTRVLLRQVARGGQDPDALCARAGVKRELLEDPEARLTGEQFEAIWSVAVRAADDPSFGLGFARELANAWPGGNILFSMMMNCPTVGQAMERFLRYHDIMADAIRPRMRVHGAQAQIWWDYFGPDFSMPADLGLTLLCLYVAMLRRLTDGALTLEQVRLSGPRPAEVGPLERVFRAPLTFGQERDELVAHRDFLERPIFLADPELLETLEQLAQKLLDRLFGTSALSNQVGVLLGKRLARGEAIGVELVARQLSMSVRSLQGKLKAEGSSYQQLLDEVRHKLALSYLKRPETSICDVAFMLGYSDQSAFNHAFKRWTGATPRAFRGKA
jgi:AraC-like DNA-binding protein